VRYVCPISYICVSVSLQKVDKWRRFAKALIPHEDPCPPSNYPNNKIFFCGEYILFFRAEGLTPPPRIANRQVGISAHNRVNRELCAPRGQGYPPLCKHRGGGCLGLHMPLKGCLRKGKGGGSTPPPRSAVCGGGGCPGGDPPWRAEARPLGPRRWAGPSSGCATATVPPGIQNLDLHQRFWILGFAFRFMFMDLESWNRSYASDVWGDLHQFTPSK